MRHRETNHDRTLMRAQRPSRGVDWVPAFLDAPLRAPIRGYYNDNHVVERDGGRVIVRVPIAGAPEMDLRRIPEHETLRFLASRDFPTPRVLARDPGGAWAVHSFVDGAPLHVRYSRGGALPDAVADRAGALLRRLHALDAAPLARWCADVAREPDTRALFDALVAFARRVHDRVRPEVAAPLARLGVPARPFEPLLGLREQLTPRAFALCHVDAHRKNLFEMPDGSLVAIDWELALVADPLYDVAVHFHRMRYAPAQEARFLAGYAAPPDARSQIDAYLALEAAKSCVGDLARYVAQFRDGLAEPERALLAEHYQGKLTRAWPLWHEGAAPTVAEVRGALEEAARV